MRRDWHFSAAFSAGCRGDRRPSLESGKAGSDMSSILKALEKVEQAQNAKRGGPSGLVKSRQRRPVWVLPVGVIGGAVVASVITFAVMGGFGKARDVGKPTAGSTRP